VVEIRECTDEELPAWTELRNEVLPQWPISVEDLRHFAGNRPDTRTLVALRDGRLVGAATHWGGENPRRGDGYVCVPEMLRGAGIGGALLAACREALAAEGKQEWWSETEDGDRHSLGFLERRGFRVRARTQEVALDLAGWTSPDWPVPAGVVLTSLAERPDLVRELWEVQNEAYPDVPPPGDEPYVPFALEAFESRLTRRAVDPRLVVVALADGSAIGYAHMTRNLVRPELGIHNLTGVRRAWRGRGVAKALKQAQLVAAQQAGLRRLLASNDLRNAPMRRLNDQLGYRREPDALQVCAVL
jgi:mycothiol synthase